MILLSDGHWAYSYILLFIIISFILEKTFVEKKEVKWLLYCLNTVIICIVSYIKGDGVGADDFNYILALNGSDVAREHFELIFGFVLQVFNFLSFTLSDLNLLITLLFCFSAILLCNEYQVSYLFWLIVFISFGSFFELNFDHIRNCMSLSFSMISIVFLNRDKRIIFLLLTLVSSLIHYSGVIFIPLIAFKYIRINQTKLLFLIFISAAVTLIPVYSVFSSIFEILNVGFLQNVYLKITSKNLDSVYADGFGWTIFSSFKYIFILIFLYLYRSKLNEQPVKIVILAYVYGMLLWGLFHEISIFSGRFFRSMSIVEPILLYYILVRLKNNIVVLLSLLAFFVVGLVLLENRIGPYWV